MDASELYRLPPEEFTAARDAAVKARRADGDREAAAALAALRRPSVGAWLVNLLAQGQPALLAELLELGPALAQAQTGRDASALRELGVQRRQLVEAVTVAAVTAGRRPVTSAVREEVAATLDAALADPSSAEAVRSGRLVRALSYAGWGDVDLSDAVAPQASSVPAAPLPRGSHRGTGDRREAAWDRERAQRIADAERAAHAAAGRLDDAVRACERTERERAAASEVADERAARVDRLTEELARARVGRDEAARAARSATTGADEALATVRRAQHGAEAARATLDALRRDG